MPESKAKIVRTCIVCGNSFLENYLEALPKDRKKVVFFDEMPWVDSFRSDFVSALEYFWNSWAVSQRNILFVATGPATSWMVDKLVANKGGA